MIDLAFSETVRTMPATILATITTLEVVLFGKNHITFRREVVIAGFEFIGKGHVSFPLVNTVEYRHKFNDFMATFRAYGTARIALKKPTNHAGGLACFQGKRR